MQFITKSEKLSQKFIQLSEQYQNIAFATAWATSNHNAFQKLLEPKIFAKIQFATIGLHFYQTEPLVLHHFKNIQQIKFSKQVHGVFHPKTYIFWNNETDWAVLIGSANFTNGAFNGKNVESSVFIQGSESSKDFFIQTLSFLQECFEKADYLTQKEIENYEALHKIRQREQQILSNQYGNQNMKNNILNVDSLNYSWPEYFNLIQQDPYHGFDIRLKILNQIHALFKKYPDFSQMDLSTRQFIAGTRGENSGWFGSMIGNGQFKNAINENSSILAQAINQIPLIGKISAKEFFDYIEIYQSVSQFADKPNSLGSATRLLSMKRPDLFFCFNSKNRDKICEELGLKNKHNITAERYWYEILQRFYDTPWFNSDKPQNSKELEAWNGKIALMDCIYYKPK